MTTEEKDAALIAVYMSFHVSQLRELPASLRRAWDLGQQLWCERQADLLKGIK